MFNCNIFSRLPLCRYTYTAVNLWLHKKLLKQHLTVTNLQFPTITSIDPYKLKIDGVRVIIIDFDGVLSSHAESSINPTIEKWLEKSVACFGSDKVFILSNKPLPIRQNYFIANPNKGQFFIAAPKKPFPNGIIAIMQQCNCKNDEILMIDDRLATGILAAIIANTRAILITKPLVNFKKHPLQESWFWILRKLERLFCSF